MKFKKILIANRGEIALRVFRTCKEMGIETVCVHSTADEDSLHIKRADESVCIGPAKVQLSYLNMPQILSAAEITGADAIHPGFGFLSENAEFAKICKELGLTFIGPRIDCIEKMGNKIVSKEIASKAGLRVLRSILVNDRDLDDLKRDVAEMGYPILIKAAAGGGGKGMKMIADESNLHQSIENLKKEAQLFFGDDTLFIEKFISKPRHVEVQILADNYGNVVHLGERDCTIQRRYQKIIEESPSPVLSDEKREEMCQASLKLAKYVNFNSVGTIEYLYSLEDEQFYFMEMNTRIQVEHPVTEQRTGIDLIAEQIKVAQGNKLELKQSEIRFSGHSIECRINAEDPETFLPSPGKITYYHRPAGYGVRVDDSVYSGYTVPPYYDSLLAKIIVSGSSRIECLERMTRALNELVIEGIKTNKNLHLNIIKNSDFRGNNYATNFLEQKIQ
jgi:acetyl-CoA carboxylase biotin carboxylase subunit